MLDLKLLRENPQQVANRLASRRFVFDVEAYQSLETERKALQQETENLQAQRNSQSKAIGIAKQKGEDVGLMIQSLTRLGEDLEQRQAELQQLQAKLQKIHEALPNMPDERVPVGDSEEDNQEICRWGTPKEFDFPIQDHVALAEAKKGLDSGLGSKLSAARFSVLRGSIAKLHRALAQFMLELHTQQHGYEEINVPLMVNNQTLFGTGQLPKFEEDLFKVESGDKENEEHQRSFYLIPTAEVPLTNLVANEIVDYQQLPLRFVCHSACFRSEAGSSGRDIRGLMRQHQFEKVELVNVVAADKSWEALEAMTTHAETVLQQLQLPYRKIALCTGDMGFGAAFTYDLEVWLPSQDTYREISSISNCLDFQALRMKARTKNPDTKKTEYLHTLNGSGVAVGRALLAVIENYQMENGDIEIPQVLQPYMGNLKVI